MSRLVEGSLVLGAIFAVLAFGGTEPVSFTIVEFLFLGLGVLLVVRPGSLPTGFSLRAFVVPALLLGAVLLQLCPFPAIWSRRIAGGGDPLPGSRLTFLSIDPHSTRTHLFVLLTCLIAFFLARIVSQDRQRKWRLIVSLVALGIFEAFYGLTQYLSGWQKIFTYTKQFDLEEATGTYINRNHYAGFLEMILPFSLALALYEYNKLRGDGRKQPAGLKKLVTRSTSQRLVLWLSIAVVLYAALIFSRSRMGIVAASASLLLIFGLMAAYRYHQRTGLLFAFAFFALSIGLAFWIGPGPVVTRFQAVGQEYTLGDQSRLSIWRDALGLIRHHPWFGTGFGTFPITFTAVQTTFLGQLVNHAHNDYLEFSSDLGLPAALILFASVAFILSRAVRAFLSMAGDFERFVTLGCVGSIVAILLHSMTDFNLYIPANTLLFSSILGLASVTQQRNEKLGRRILAT
jgi:O-antigen ligase